MKNPLPYAVLLASTLAFACKPATELPLAPATVAAQELERAQALARHTAEEFQDRVFAQRAEFAMNMHRQLAELNQSLDEFSAQLSKASAAAQAEAKPQLDALRDQSGKLRRHLGEITNATPSTWTVLKADAEKAFVTLQAGLAKLRQQTSEKITP